MRRIDKVSFVKEPQRYELRQGDSAGAPSCPYGNTYQWIGFDKESQEYVRFSKRLFKSLVYEYNEQ